MTDNLMQYLIEQQQKDMIRVQQEAKRKRILWIDIETTGTNPLKDDILQIALIITDDKNRTLIEREYIVKHKLKKVWKKADDYVKEMHTKTGLWDRIEIEGVELSKIDEAISKLIKDNMMTDYPLNIAGNSVHFDNSFIQAQMTETAKLLSHRVLDMSAVFQWFRVYGNKVDMPKHEVSHDALDDIRHSIEQSRYALNKLEEIKNTFKGSAISAGSTDSYSFQKNNFTILDDTKIKGDENE